MSKKPESRLQLRIQKALKKEYGGYWRKIHGSMFMAGIPDILGCCQSLFIALEIKVDENEDPSILQKKNLDMISDSGGLAFTVSSVEEALSVVREHLLKHGKKIVKPKIKKKSVRSILK